MENVKQTKKKISHNAHKLFWLLYFNRAVQSVGCWSEEWGSFSSSTGCGRWLKCILVAEEVPGHHLSTAKVPSEQGTEPLNTLLRPCNEQNTHPVMYPAFTEMQPGQTAASSRRHEEKAVKEKKKKPSASQSKLSSGTLQCPLAWPPTSNSGAGKTHL